LLTFRVGPFPVSISVSFLVGAVLLGLGWGVQFDWRMLAWIFVVFVSVLAHELGHAVVGRAFGGHPEIRLEMFGGVTFPQFSRRPGPGRQFLLSVAGPVAGLLLGAGAYALLRALPPNSGSPSDWTMSQFIAVSVIWAVFNLLPILPLDGGQMMLAVIEGARRRPSVVLASWISFAVSLLAGALATLVFGFEPLNLIWFGLFAFQNLARARAAGVDEAPRPPAHPVSGDAFEKTDVEKAAEEARAAVLARDYESALAAAAKLEDTGGPFRQAAALRLRAGIELARGDNEAAALFAGQSFSLLANPDAAVVAARANLRAGQEDRARNWLRRALEAGAPPGAVRADPELGFLA
jgi:Zn-dependent protease